MAKTIDCEAEVQRIMGEQAEVGTKEGTVAVQDSCETGRLS
jgi:hypothetical protein